MVFSKRITVPANTLEVSAKIDYLILTSGVLNNIRVIMPTGHGGLVHCRIFYEEKQIFPFNPDTDYSSGDVDVNVNVFITRPHEIKILTWNLDTVDGHSPCFFFNVDTSSIEHKHHIPKTIKKSSRWDWFFGGGF
ncbi:MAG: hypothetical protein ABIJ18_05765 [archaeon]